MTTNHHSVLCNCAFRAQTDHEVKQDWQICRFREYLPPPISTETVHIVANLPLYGILAMLTANGTLTSCQRTNVVLLTVNHGYA